MMIAHRTIILVIRTVITLSILPTPVTAYIPSVHPHDTAIIEIKSSLMKALTKNVTTNNPTTVVPSKKSLISNIDHPDKYWFDKRIHELGNNGFWGAVHASLAPFSTKIIDISSYHGVDVRLNLAHELSDLVGTHNARILDLCCGVGISTRALHHAFPNASTVIGIDTSGEMVAMANFLTKYLQLFSPIVDAVFDCYETLTTRGPVIRRASTYKAMKFLQENAESTRLPDQSFDLVTVMWAFHEAPLQGRAKILKEARRLLSPGGVLAVVDISSDFVPSKAMLKGEPYVEEYQQNIHRQLQNCQGFKRSQYRPIVEKHLGIWTLTRSAIAKNRIAI